MGPRKRATYHCISLEHRVVECGVQGTANEPGLKVANSRMIVSILLVGVAALIAAYAFTLWNDADPRPDAASLDDDEGCAGRIDAPSTPLAERTGELTTSRSPLYGRR